MSRFGTAFVVALCLGGCGSLYGPRDDPPALSISSRKPLKEATNCVVVGLNDAMRATNPLANSITHAAQIVEIDRVHEVAPQQTLTVGAELYFVRITREPTGSKIELFTRVILRDRLADGISRCSTPTG